MTDEPTTPVARTSLVAAAGAVFALVAMITCLHISAKLDNSICLSANVTSAAQVTHR